MNPSFDVITMGRTGVDKYPLETGVPLEKVESFCPPAPSPHRLGYLGVPPRERSRAWERVSPSGNGRTTDLLAEVRDGATPPSTAAATTPESGPPKGNPHR